MAKKILLLNNSYEVLNFITERRAIRLIFNDKCEIISEWEDEITWFSGSMKLPSILKLKNNVRRNYYSTVFSRPAVLKRDNKTCQYCNTKLRDSQITIDHIIPKSQGGSNSFINCVVSCHACNNMKANRTPEQANMTLLKRPVHPSYSNFKIDEPQEFWHSDWNDYII